MAGLGYRREMADWDLSALAVDFFEVAPENWLWRDRSRLHQMRALGKPVHLHGVSLNLGGSAPLDLAFVREVRALIQELGAPFYSDHLAASGDTHALYDLFPVPFTRQEACRVADRIAQVQDVLGQRIAFENTTWYTNVGDLPEPVFVSLVLERADCHLLLDLNNITVNQKNHGGPGLADWGASVDWKRVSYLHVAGHEYDARFGMHIDTHSQPVEAATATMARQWHADHRVPILLEWDHDLPDEHRIAQELACL